MGSWFTEDFTEYSSVKINWLIVSWLLIETWHVLIVRRSAEPFSVLTTIGFSDFDISYASFVRNHRSLQTGSPIGLSREIIREGYPSLRFPLVWCAVKAKRLGTGSSPPLSPMPSFSPRAIREQIEAKPKWRACSQATVFWPSERRMTRFEGERTNIQCKRFKITVSIQRAQAFVSQAMAYATAGPLTTPPLCQSVPLEYKLK